LSLEKFGDWKRLEKTLDGIQRKIEAAMRKATRKNALLLERHIKKGIQTSKPAGGKSLAPLHPLTIQLKGSSKPLVDNADMLNAITHKMVGKTDAVVGLLRNVPKKGATGAAIGLVNLGWIHEHGWAIRVTPKMREYLASQGMPLKATTTHIKIPARPFVRPVFEDKKVQREFVRIYKDAIESVLTGEAF